MSATAIAFSVYLLIILVIGFIASKLNKSNEDYLLGGRKINGWFLAFSERASGESAWLILGLPAAGLTVGLGESWTALGCVSGILFAWFFIARPLRARTAQMHSLTLPQYLGSLFGGCRIITGLGALITIFFYTIYVASGFNAAGTILNFTFEMDPTTGVLIGAVVVTLYTMLGGFAAVVYTDVLQALLMFATCVILPVVAIMDMGGIGAFTEAISQVQDPVFLSWTNGKPGIEGLLFVLGGLGWGFGYLGQPHLLTRYMAMPSDADVKKGWVVAALWAIPAFAGALLIGLIAKVVFTTGQLDAAGINLADPTKEKLMPFFATTYVIPVIAGVLISGAIAAMMSTADTQLLVCVSALCEDLYHRVLRKEPGEKQLLILSRGFTIAVCLVALGITLSGNQTIMGMVSYAWGGLGSTFGPLVILSLYWGGLKRKGVIAGLIFGFLGTILWRNGFFAGLPVQEIAPERFSIFLLNIPVIMLFSKLGKQGKSS